MDNGDGLYLTPMHNRRSRERANSLHYHSSWTQFDPLYFIPLSSSLLYSLTAHCAEHNKPERSLAVSQLFSINTTHSDDIMQSLRCPLWL
jgi:hypothetical protein